MLNNLNVFGLGMVGPWFYDMGIPQIIILLYFEGIYTAVQVVTISL